ncbi:endo alpha-1,4 polygalactosaminidase [Paracoccus laeviglucosivorans]|uniref:Glycoside-hydrolase family GH114 n=1 Tax=Paracoccus laeviglucosivorans TaxID=1197861 RepID=A0A521AZP1_9RHOB|nr:endo alpha-1,4 polygalactosaminidase [Paracoccus laeviglucosivorans]SMO40324.1 Glycoside-hydrolase family GH114 [Paracoccus laeviglucosivorans]
MKHFAPAVMFVWVIAAPGCADTEWRLPPTAGAADYQLGGAYRPDPRVTIVARDSHAQPEPGLYNICYVNGFQTQPGELQTWIDDHPDAVLHDGEGNPVSDPGWPDEYALDTRSARSRTQIAEVVGRAIARCAASGFDAVEFDNLDSWTRFDGLTEQGNLALAAELVDLAHHRGLAAGQKNAPDLGDKGPGAGFDFVISEECAAWNECGAYRAQYGSHHIDIEYQDALPKGHSFDTLCRLPDQPDLTVLRDHLLRTPGQPGYVFGLCPVP